MKEVNDGGVYLILRVLGASVGRARSGSEIGRAERLWYKTCCRVILPEAYDGSMGHAILSRGNAYPITHGCKV